MRIKNCDEAELVLQQVVLHFFAFLPAKATAKPVVPLSLELGIQTTHATAPATSGCGWCAGLCRVFGFRTGASQTREVFRPIFLLVLGGLLAKSGVKETPVVL